MHQKQLLALFYGWIVIFSILIIASSLLALFLKFTPFNEPLLSWLTLSVGIIALFSGGLIAGLRGRMRGWMIGLVIGLGFSAFTLFYQYMSIKQFFNLQQSLYHILYIFMAVIGGIVGVNRQTS